MARGKGTTLKQDEKWSDEFIGYIEKQNGLFRKPSQAKKSDGVLTCRNQYFTVMNCCVCGNRTLKNTRNAGRAVCSRECQNVLISVDEGSKKRKRANGEDDHIMVKDSSHPFRNRENRVPEHRLVVENRIGRYLTRDERVHHINCVKSDNRFENLVLCNDNTEHFLIHGSLNKCVDSLIKMGVLVFNRECKRYEVVNDNNWS